MPELSAIENLITHMPKVELHVHLEGSVRPETLLKLAARHQVYLPVHDVTGLREWYQFRNFDHFIKIYTTISSCLRTAEDIELITREFLQGQAEQNIQYSEVTFTPYSQFINNQLDFNEQMEAVNRARARAETDWGVKMGIIMDIPRQIDAEDGLAIAERAVERFGDGLIAFGLGGPEKGNPPEKFKAAFDLVREAGIPCILHAGETGGPESIWKALNVASSRRIGHGVRAIEDPALMEHLKQNQIPLEVCPSSNICLKVFPSLAEHSLPQLMEQGLFVTINSDDPPMFNTTLTNEYSKCQQAFGWDAATIEKLVMNGVKASLLPEKTKLVMLIEFDASFQKLRRELEL